MGRTCTRCVLVGSMTMARPMKTPKQRTLFLQRAKMFCSEILWLQWPKGKVKVLSTRSRLTRPHIDYARNSPLSSQVLLLEEVWHEKLPNSFDFWRGMPTRAVVTTAVGTDYAASKGIMENNGDAGTILRTSEQLDPEQRELLLAA